MGSASSPTAVLYTAKSSSAKSATFSRVLIGIVFVPTVLKKALIYSYELKRRIPLRVGAIVAAGSVNTISSVLHSNVRIAQQVQTYAFIHRGVCLSVFVRFVICHVRYIE